MRGIPTGSRCAVALELALQAAREVVAGIRSPMSGASVMAHIGLVDCYEFLQEDKEVIDALGAFAELADQWETEHDDEEARQRIAVEVRAQAEAWLRLVGVDP